MIAYSIEFYLMLNIVNNAWRQYDFLIVEKQRKVAPRRLAVIGEPDKYFFRIKNQKPQQ